VRARPRRKDQPVCRGRKFLAGGTAGPLPGVHRAASQELTYTRWTHPSPMRGARIPFPSKVHVNGICSRAQRVDAADAEGRGEEGHCDLLARPAARACSLGSPYEKARLAGAIPAIRDVTRRDSMRRDSAEEALVARAIKGEKGIGR